MSWPTKAVIFIYTQYLYSVHHTSCTCYIQEERGIGQYHGIRLLFMQQSCLHIETKIMPWDRHTYYRYHILPQYGSYYVKALIYINIFVI